MNQKMQSKLATLSVMKVILVILAVLTLLSISSVIFSLVAGIIKVVINLAIVAGIVWVAMKFGRSSRN